MTTAFTSYKLPKFGTEDEQQRAYLNKLFNDIYTQITTGVIPAGAAGGDLSGTYPNPTVLKIRNQPLGLVVPGSGFLFVGDGASWNGLSISGDVTVDAAGFTTVIGLATVPLVALPVSDGDILIYRSGVGWNARTVNGDATLSQTGTVTIGPSFVKTGTTAGGDLTGTYPNPTLANPITHSQKFSGIVSGTTEFANGVFGATGNISWSANGQYQSLQTTTLTPCTITYTTNPAGPTWLTLKIIAPAVGTSPAVTLPGRGTTSVTPTLAKDTIMLVYWDGSAYWSFAAVPNA